MGKISKSYLKDLYSQKKYKSGGFSTEGYKRNSPDVNNPYNVIPSNQITMKDVDFPIMGIDDMGYQQMMYPGNDYTYPGNYVTEFPLKNMGNKRYGQVGFYKPDFRSKSQIANTQGGQREYTNVPVKRTPTEAKAIREKELAELKRKTVGTIRETTDADREAQNRQALTFAGNAEKRGASSPLNDILDVVNPFSYYYSAKDVGKGLGETAKGIYNVDPNQIGAGLTQAAFGALGVLPAAAELKPALKGAGKYLTTQTPLKNTYKMNPWAFKPDPKAYYRMIGKEGYTDALESGVVRPPQTTRIFDQGSQQYKDIPIAAYDDAYYNAQFPLDKRWYPNSIKKTNPQKAALATKSGYQGPYMAEVTGDSHLFEKGENVAAYTGPNSSQTVTYSKEHIPITNPNLKFYKEHWLKGYKEVPKLQMGGTMGIPGVNGQVVSSGPQPLSSVKKTRGPITKNKKGDVKTMSNQQVKQVLKYSKQKPNKI